MECSPSALRFIVSEYAKILVDHAAAFDGVVLVTPTPEHFPDEFRRDGESVLRLLERVASYTPLASDLPMTLGFVEGEEKPRSCSSGACGTSGWSRVDGVLDEGDGYRVPVHVLDTGNATRLVASLARGAGAMLVVESGEEQDEDIGARSEVWAAASGLGIFLANAAHVYAKGCGGVSIHQGTALDVHAQTMLLALFCALHGIKPSKARAHLELTQRESFDEAVRVVESNDELVEQLKETPELLTDGVFELAPPKGLLSRFFSGKKKTEVAPVSVKPKSEEEQRRLAEARALVDEVLQSSARGDRIPLRNKAFE